MWQQLGRYTRPVEQYLFSSIPSIFSPMIRLHSDCHQISLSARSVGSLIPKTGSVTQRRGPSTYIRFVPHTSRIYVDVAHATKEPVYLLTGVYFFFSQTDLYQRQSQYTDV